MRAVQVTQPGRPVEIRDIEEPTPGPDDVLVEVHRVGVSFPDLLLSKGQYQIKPEPPFTLGVDFAGTVVSGPEGYSPGQRVAGVLPYGGAAERVAVPAQYAFALPDTMSYDEGAALPMNYLTALFALKERGQVRPGEVVLIHGAAGGVGTAAIQVAKGLGAESVAVVSTDEKEAVARRRRCRPGRPDRRPRQCRQGRRRARRGRGRRLHGQPQDAEPAGPAPRGRVRRGAGDPGGQGQPAAAQQHRRPRRRLGCLRDGDAGLHAGAVARPRADAGRRHDQPARSARPTPSRTSGRRWPTWRLARPSANPS